MRLRHDQQIIILLLLININILLVCIARNLSQSRNHFNRSKEMALIPTICACPSVCLSVNRLVFVRLLVYKKHLCENESARSPSYLI